MKMASNLHLAKKHDIFEIDKFKRKCFKLNQKTLLNRVKNQVLKFYKKMLFTANKKYVRSSLNQVCFVVQSFQKT